MRGFVGRICADIIGSALTRAAALSFWRSVSAAATWRAITGNRRASSVCSAPGTDHSLRSPSNRAPAMALTVATASTA
jgi:hypothetical protein